MEPYFFNEIIVITSVISLTAGFYMLFLYKSTSGKGTGYWSAGALVIGAGLILKLLATDTLLGITWVSPILVTLGLYLYLAGIWQFKGKKVRPEIVFGVPLLDLVQALGFTFFLPFSSLSKFLHFGIMLFYALLAIYETTRLNPDQRHLRSIFRLMAGAYLVFSLLILLILFSIHPQYIPLPVRHISFLTFTIFNFLMIVLTFGFLTAHNIELNRELNIQLQAKNKFFSIIAHDISGSMSTIMSFLNLINNDPDFKETEKKKYLGSLESLSQSTYNLLQNLLEWATSSKSPTTDEGEVIDLNQIIKDNLAYFERSAQFKSINLSFNQGEAPTIIGNSKMIEVILRNLVSNATKFTPTKGQITITTKRGTNRKVYVHVKDTGIGIAPEKLKKLARFEKSSPSCGTEGEPGSGYGLALCKEFIRELKGTIHFESQPDVGTAVIIEFPAA